ncbi:MAG: sulfite dehydrogenase [Paralcaligenes sp.]
MQEQKTKARIKPYKDPDPLARRNFLRTGATAVAGVMAGGVAARSALAAEAATDNLPPEVPAWMKTPGALVGSKPYGQPSVFEKDVIRDLRPTDKQYYSSSTRSPLQDLDGMITPNGLFYERHHNGVPNIDPAQHRLMIHGLVKSPLIFTVEDIRRFPSHSQIYFLECSGNPGYTFYGKTAAQANGLVSCAEWTGVKLKTVLEEVGLLPSAKWVVAEGADAAAMTRSIPLEKCLDDAMLVYSQNGERLRPEQGYPLRLLVPGFEGNMNVKWLRRLHIVDEPVYSREETSKYTDLQPDGKAREFTFYMEAKSIITAPSGGQRVAQKGFCEIKGIAWSGKGKIARVDVSVDDGKTWQQAELLEPILTKALTRFRMPWTWNGEAAVIQSRATDETGYVQPTLEALVAVRGVNGVYHNNAMTAWRIAENGEVTNARL